MMLKTMKLLALVAVCLFSVSVFAQVQKCTDKNGKVTYAHAVCPANTKQKKTVMAYTPRSQPKGATNASAPGRQEGIDDDLHELRSLQAKQAESVQKANQLLQARKKMQ